MYVGKGVPTFENKCLRIFTVFYSLVIDDSNSDSDEEFVDKMLPSSISKTC